MKSGPKLRSVDLDDNLIATLADLQPLRDLSGLRDLRLRSRQTDNPVCRLRGYQGFVVSNFPGLEMLDSAPLARKESAPQPAPEPKQRLSPRDNRRENADPNVRPAGGKSAQEELKRILFEVPRSPSQSS